MKHLAKFKNIGGTFIEVSVESKEEGYKESPLKNPTRENLYTTDPTSRTNKDNQWVFVNNDIFRYYIHIKLINLIVSSLIVILLLIHS